MLNTCQPSVSRCIHAVTDGINQCLFKKWIKFSMIGAELQKAEENIVYAP